MAYVVARPGRRFEIREAHSTPAGPRSRTLATFRQLDDEVLARAASRAAATFDGDAVRAAARRAGAPVSASTADRAARQLLLELRAGRPPAPGLAAIVSGAIGGATGVPDSVAAMAEWIGASPAERGAALVDLLQLVDHLPARRAGPLRFPGLDPSRATRAIRATRGAVS
jgi:hypothetical protein